jgi:FkbM family methyltransferase
MLTELVTGTAQLINAMGGKHGEYMASQIVDRVPGTWIPARGRRDVRRLGMRWTLDLDDNVQRRLYVVGSYEALTLDAVASLLRPHDVVLDVGANIGAIALPLARKLRGCGRVVAVEAAADTADRLRWHVRVNGLTDRVHIVQAGLSDRTGSARLRTSGFGQHDVGTRTLEGDSPDVGEPVDLVTGDALREQLGVDRFDIIKIDVEGHELAVLRGLDRTFAEAPPRVVLLEVVAGNQQRAGLSTDALVQRMHELGYRGTAIRHRGLVPLSPHFSGNVIFMRVTDR